MAQLSRTELAQPQVHSTWWICSCTSKRKWLQDNASYQSSKQFPQLFQHKKTTAQTYSFLLKIYFPLGKKNKNLLKITPLSLHCNAFYIPKCDTKSCKVQILQLELRRERPKRWIVSGSNTRVDYFYFYFRGFISRQPNIKISEVTKVRRKKNINFAPSSISISFYQPQTLRSESKF